MPRSSASRESLLSSSPLLYWRIGRGVQGPSTSSHHLGLALCGRAVSLAKRMMLPVDEMIRRNTEGRSRSLDRTWLRQLGSALPMELHAASLRFELPSSSPGQIEGQSTKLKLVKLQMYGRSKLDLLELRLAGGAWL